MEDKASEQCDQVFLGGIQGRTPSSFRITSLEAGNGLEGFRLDLPRRQPHRVLQYEEDNLTEPMQPSRASTCKFGQSREGVPAVNQFHQEPLQDSSFLRMNESLTFDDMVQARGIPPGIFRGRVITDGIREARILGHGWQPTSRGGNHPSTTNLFRDPSWQLGQRTHTDWGHASTWQQPNVSLTPAQPRGDLHTGLQPDGIPDPANARADMTAEATAEASTYCRAPAEGRAGVQPQALTLEDSRLAAPQVLMEEPQPSEDTPAIAASGSIQPSQEAVGDLEGKNPASTYPDFPSPPRSPIPLPFQWGFEASPQAQRQPGIGTGEAQNGKVRQGQADSSAKPTNKAKVIGRKRKKAHAKKAKKVSLKANSKKSLTAVLEVYSGQESQLAAHLCQAAGIEISDEEDNADLLNMNINRTSRLEPMKPQDLILVAFSSLGKADGTATSEQDIMEVVRSWQQQSARSHHTSKKNPSLTSDSGVWPGWKQAKQLGSKTKGGCSTAVARILRQSRCFKKVPDKVGQNSAWQLSHATV